MAQAYIYKPWKIMCSRLHRGQRTRSNQSEKPACLIHRRMSTQMLTLGLLLVGTVLLSQGCCQHWSYGLSPGGKRELDGLSDTLGNIVEGFPHVDAPCGVLGCAGQPDFPKMYRMKEFLDNAIDRETGHRTYKK